MIWTLALSAAAVVWFAPVRTNAIDFESVVQIARAAAQRPLADVDRECPAVLQEIGYDQWRDIRFRK